MDWHARCRREPHADAAHGQRQDHCLQDLLFRHRDRARCRSTSPRWSRTTMDLAGLVERHGVPFHARAGHAPTPSRRPRHGCWSSSTARPAELVVLARYMQVLSPDLCPALAGRAINIHHSFLPSFKGARPYHQAHDRGVKLIGATAHYVTAGSTRGRSSSRTSPAPTTAPASSSAMTGAAIEAQSAGRRSPAPPLPPAPPSPRAAARRCRGPPAGHYVRGLRPGRPATPERNTLNSAGVAPQRRTTHERRRPWTPTA